MYKHSTKIIAFVFAVGSCAIFADGVGTQQGETSALSPTQSGSSEKMTGDKPYAAVENQPHTKGGNTTVVFNGIECKITDFTKGSGTDTPAVTSLPANAVHYRIVHYQCKNNTPHPIPGFSAPQLSIFDPAGRQYDADFTASRDYARIAKLGQRGAATLERGASFYGADVFEVQEAADTAQGDWSLRITDRGRLIDMTLKP